MTTPAKGLKAFVPIPCEQPYRPSTIGKIAKFIRIKEQTGGPYKKEVFSAFFRFLYVIGAITIFGIPTIIEIEKAKKEQDRRLYPFYLIIRQRRLLENLPNRELTYPEINKVRRINNLALSYIAVMNYQLKYGIIQTWKTKLLDQIIFLTEELEKRAPRDLF